MGFLHLFRCDYWTITPGPITSMGNKLCGHASEMGKKWKSPKDLDLVVITRRPQTRRACECHAPSECKFSLVFGFPPIFPIFGTSVEPRAEQHPLDMADGGLSLLGWLHSLIWWHCQVLWPSQKAEKLRTKSLRLRLFSQVPQQKLGFRISNLDLMASSGEGILYTFFYSPLWPAYKSDPHHKWVLCKALSTESHFRSDRNFDLQDPFELIIGMIIYLCCSIKLINFGHPVEGKEIWNSKLPIELVTFLKFRMCNYVGKSAPNYPSNC